MTKDPESKVAPKCLRPFKDHLLKLVDLGFLPDVSDLFK